MSYLTTPELAEFDKAVISFWFRVPKAALEAAKKEFDQEKWPDPVPPLWGMVPLVVFGKEGTSPTTSDGHGSSNEQTTSSAVTYTVMTSTDKLEGSGIFLVYTIAWFPDPDATGTYTDTRSYYETSWNTAPIPGKPTNPSFIAIDGSGKLQINFESTQTGEVTLPSILTAATSKYYTQETVKQCWTYPFLADCEAGGDTVTGTPDLCGMMIVVFAMVGYKLLTAVADHMVDQGSSPRVDHPSSRTYGPSPGDMGTGAIRFTVPKELEADKWHHVVVSVDMTGGSVSTGHAAGSSSSFEETVGRISATSLLYVAVDDIDYPTGGILWPKTNKVVTGGAATIAGMGQAADYDDAGTMTPQGAIPSYSLKDMKVPAGKVGIPSIGKYVDKIRRIEMSEFLFFTDVVLDTSKVESRRLFVTSKGKDGKQRPTNTSPLSIPYLKYAAGDPATWEPLADTPAYVPPLFDPSLWPTEIKAFGANATADIDFTKCSWNWQMGRNLGTLDGKVEKIGKIKEYFPDPSIEGESESGSGSAGAGASGSGG